MTLKINFCDFWPGFESNNLFLKFLEKHYTVSIATKPDYLFYSVYGNKHLKYDNCIKILYTGENLVPDFNLCDYAIGFHYLNFGDRYLRFPLYVYYQKYYREILKDKNDHKNDSFFSFDKLVNRKFCNFVYSNNVNSDPARDVFFHQLCKYRKVDSGGKHLNNIGAPVSDKLQFIKDYKFTIAFENSSVPGYTTEKLLEPILVKSLPIYYGNPLVHLDFNIDSFINVKGINDFERAIEEIILLDQNDDLYIEKLNQEKFKAENNLELWEERLLIFTDGIFNQPSARARRRSEFGFTRFHVQELMKQTELLEKAKRKLHFKARIKEIIGKYSPK